MTDATPSPLTLLVDDDIAYLEVLKFFLEREGVMECEIATSAKQALEMMAQKEYDAVVSDYLMPEMDGLELLKILRLQGKDTPFVMLTGRGREDIAIEALNNGADYYLQKGGDPKAQYTDLANMIKKAARQRRAERRVIDDELFLKKLLESVQDGVSVLAKDLSIEMVNPTIEKWYAGSMPLVGRKCYEVFRGLPHPCEDCPSLEAISSGRAISTRIPRRGPDGKDSGWMEVFSVPVTDSGTDEVKHVIEYIRDVTEEEDARRALQRSERRYRAVAELADEGILAIDPGGEIAFVNPSMAKMLGYEPDEMIGMRIWSIVDTTSVGPMSPGQLHKIMDEGGKVGIVLNRKDGSKAQAVVAASPVSSDRSIFQGGVVVVTDVSELKDLVDGMVSSEAKFAEIFRTSPQMIMVARTEDSVILDVNPSFTKATGYSEDQLIGKSYIDLGIVSRDLYSKMERLLAENGLVFDLETTYGTASGEERVVRLSSYRLTLQGQDCTVFMSCDLSSAGVGERELRHERDVLKSLLEHTPNGIVIVDPKGRLVEANETVRSMLGGVTRESLIGTDVYTILGAEEGAKARRVIEKLLREGVVRDISFKITRDDGIVMLAEVSASVVNDALGKPLYFVGVVRDATDQVRYQSTLEKALEDRRQMESIIDDGPAVAFRWLEEPGWPVDYVSANVRSFGYEAEDLKSGAVKFVSIIHPEDRERVVKEAENHLREGRREFEQEYRIISPEGDVFWVYDKTKPIWRPDGSLEACHGVVVDITEVKDALERLSRTEKQLKLFMDMSPVIKFIKDREGKYVYVNAKLLETFGLPSDGWIGKTDRDLFPPDVARRFAESDRAVLEKGEKVYFQEVVPQADGPHEYLTHKFLVPSMTGGEDLIAGIVIDQTDEKRYQRALKAANEKLSLLGSMTRHDIMNQLAVLTGWLDIVCDDETDPAKLKKIDSIKKASAAIQDLLVFTSEYQDIGSKQPVWVPLKAALSEGATGLQIEGLSVESEIENIEVYADPMLEMVFRNLIDNSLRHGEKVTKVRLSSRIQDGGLVIVYEDDGVGVPEDVKESIFDRGVGAHTGLGLFLARQVLSLTGITIKETGTPGKGARFEMLAPEGSHRRTSGKD